MLDINGAAEAAEHQEFALMQGLGGCASVPLVGALQPLQTMLPLGKGLVAKSRHFHDVHRTNKTKRAARASLSLIAQY